MNWFQRLRYLWGAQCSDTCGEDHCRRRAGHSGWHTKNGNLYWGNKRY